MGTIPSGRASRAAAAALVLAGGCDSVWLRAGQSHAVDPSLLGATVAADGRPELLVGYSVWDGRLNADRLNDLVMTVPLSADGWPLPPFRPTTTVGIDRDGDRRFAHDVPDEQQAQLRAAVTAAVNRRDDLDRLSRLLASGNFTKAGGQTDDRSPAAPARFDGFVVLAYAVYPDGSLGRVDTRAQFYRNTVDLPAGTRLLLLPSAVERPAGDQGHDQVTAALVEPVAIPAEVVGTAVLVVAILPALPFAIILAATLRTSRPPSVDLKGVTRAAGPPPSPPLPVVPIRIADE